MQDSNFPDNFHVDVAIIVSHDVTHASHFPKGKLRDGLAGCFCPMGRGFSYDFDAPNHCVLLLVICQKIGFGRVFLSTTQ